MRMNTFNILLVEDDIETHERYIHEVNKYEELYFIGITNSSSQAINDIKAYSPDAIILDLELNYGSGSGIDVLKYLQACNSRPYVIVVTNNPSAATHNIVRALGADYILYKQQDNFSEEQVISFLYNLIDIIKTQRKVTRNTNKSEPTSRDKKILDAICTELNLIGINTKHKGFSFLMDAILIAINSSQENVITELAKKYGQTKISVIRTMKYAIEYTWGNEDINTLELHYKGSLSSNRCCPTVTEFISYYATTIKNRFLD